MINKLFVLVLSIILLGGCNKEEHAKLEQIKLEATSPIRKDISITKEYVCQIHAYKHIELRSLERGYLQNIFVDEGQSVIQNQPMFKIMPNLYQVDLKKTKAEADAINIEYKNTKALAEKNIVSENELLLAKARLDKANAEVMLAETHLNFTNINAPFSGIMDHLNVRNGSLINEGDLLTTLSDISKMWVYFNVPEAEYLNFKHNKDTQAHIAVSLKMANGEIFDQKGLVDTIEADFDNKTGNIEFRSTFPNPNKILRHGGTGNILISVPYKNALLIPQKATFEILDKTYVYVIDKENKLEQRLITIDAELPYIYVVKQGLKEDDRILLEGLRKVHNSQKVEVNFKDPQKVLSGLNLHAE